MARRCWRDHVSTSRSHWIHVCVSAIGYLASISRMCHADRNANRPARLRLTILEGHHHRCRVARNRRGSLEGGRGWHRDQYRFQDEFGHVGRQRPADPGHVGEAQMT